MTFDEPCKLCLPATLDRYIDKTGLPVSIDNEILLRLSSEFNVCNAQETADPENSAQ